jgi:hypothetical protein
MSSPWTVSILLIGAVCFIFWAIITWMPDALAGNYA